MRNNILVFLAFAVVCLMNITGKYHGTNPPLSPTTAPKSDLKMAEATPLAPAVKTAPLTGPQSYTANAK